MVKTSFKFNKIIVLLFQKLTIKFLIILINTQSDKNNKKTTVL